MKLIRLRRPTNSRRYGRATRSVPENLPIRLARALPADFAIIDERSARRLAQVQGVAVMGCVGILERGHGRGLVADLRGTYSTRQTATRCLAHANPAT